MRGIGGTLRKDVFSHDRALETMSPPVTQLDTDPDGSVGRQRLFEIIRTRSFGRGEVRLASGRVSDFYFDLKPTMLDPEGAFLIARFMYAAVREIGADCVGGLEMGAVPITGAVGLFSHLVGEPLRGIFVRKIVKEHGSKRRIEGLAPGETLDGRRLVVLEDVTTTGESALAAADVLLEAGANVAGVVSIVDRGEGATQTFDARDIPFRALFSAGEFLAS